MLICQDTPYSEKMKLLRNRFGEIFQNICLEHNSYLHEYDKFSKVITFLLKPGFAAILSRTYEIGESRPKDNNMHG